VCLGRREEALEAIQVEEERFAGSVIEKKFVSHLRGLLGGDRAQAIDFLESLMRTGFRDGEGVFYSSRSLAYLGETDLAIQGLRKVLEYGFFCYPTFVRDPWLDRLRGMPAFVELLKAAEARHHDAVTRFTDHGGDRLLGMRSTV